MERRLYRVRLQGEVVLFSGDGQVFIHHVDELRLALSAWWEIGHAFLENILNCVCEYGLTRSCVCANQQFFFFNVCPYINLDLDQAGSHKGESGEEHSNSHPLQRPAEPTHSSQYVDVCRCTRCLSATTCAVDRWQLIQTHVKLSLHLLMSG